MTLNLVTNQAIPIGPELGAALDLATGAALPVLLVGRHGIGKSEYLEGYARERGRRPYVLDLSLLEATDLTGLPYRDGEVTRFAPPGTLPPADDSTPALLVLEELNRCDRSVRQPCLQLLTARRLNDYVLPERCALAACINPVEGGYQVDELDEALASRFVRLQVQADRAPWVAWARSASVDEDVVKFVERYPQAFKVAPPRTWTYAARMLTEARARSATGLALQRALGGVLPALAVQAFMAALSAPDVELPSAETVVEDPEAHLALFERLAREKRIDALKHLLDQLDDYLLRDEGHARLASKATREALARLVAVAPPDLRRSVEGHFPAEAVR